ncbi:unnamed protein product, partial [Gulo gulo]
ASSSSPIGLRININPALTKRRSVYSLTCTNLPTPHHDPGRDVLSLSSPDSIFIRMSPCVSSL